jgi:hypothetical protein
MAMSDDPIDFTPLDPTADDLRFERLVRAVNARAAPLLAARRARHSAVGELTRWWRPMIAAAAVVIGVSVATLIGVEAASSAAASSNESTVAVAEAPTTLSDAMGIPESYAQVVANGTPVAAADLLLEEAR